MVHTKILSVNISPALYKQLANRLKPLDPYSNVR